MIKAYKNITYFFLALLVCMFFGFYKPYFGAFPNFDKSTTTIVHIHATALIIWVILLVVQPFLVRYKKIRVHRLLGKFTYFLVPVIVITSVAVMSKQYYEGIGQKMSPIESLKTLLIPFGEIALFSIFYLLAIIYRHNTALHMRYIICNALVLITPCLARVTGYWFDLGQLKSYSISFFVSDLILVALVLFDRSKKLNPIPYIVTLALFLIFHIGWYLAGHPF